MGLGVLETEDEVDVRVIQQGLEGPGDVLGPGLVLAVDQSDLTSRLGLGCVQDALGRRCQKPMLPSGPWSGRACVRPWSDRYQPDPDMSGSVCLTLLRK